MKTSELIGKLLGSLTNHGDLPVVLSIGMTQEELKRRTKEPVLVYTFEVNVQEVFNLDNLETFISGECT